MGEGVNPGVGVKEGEANDGGEIDGAELVDVNVNAIWVPTIAVEIFDIRIGVGVNNTWLTQGALIIAAPIVATAPNTAVNILTIAQSFDDLFSIFISKLLISSLLAQRGRQRHGGAVPQPRWQVNFARPAPTARPRRSRVRCTRGWLAPLNKTSTPCQTPSAFHSSL